MPISDNWDWPYIIYVGRVWLCYTDADIWRLTPRQFKAQLDVHEDINNKMYSSGATNTNSQRSMARKPLGFIDQIKGW